MQSYDRTIRTPNRKVRLAQSQGMPSPMTKLEVDASSHFGLSLLRAPLMTGGTSFDG